MHEDTQLGKVVVNEPDGPMPSKSRIPTSGDFAVSDKVDIVEQVNGKTVVHARGLAVQGVLDGEVMVTLPNDDLREKAKKHSLQAVAAKM